MSGCQTCGGFGNRHDPIAHDDYDESEAHDALHPWYFAGCDDCDDRADAKEVER